MKTSIKLMGLAAVLLSSGCAHHHRHITDTHAHNQTHLVRHSTHQAHFGHADHKRHNEHHLQSHYIDNQLQLADTNLPLTNPLHGWQPPPHSYRPAYTHKLLGDYAEQIAMKLVENMRYVTVNTPVAVASFVDLDSSLGRTNILGNQMAESFITELQEFGIPVMDYKTTGVIHVGQNGDYVFSRNTGELKQNLGIKYVLSGTMTYNDRGVILNVRMVDMLTKVVVASTKGFIPQFVVDSLYPSNLVDGIILNSAG